MLFTGFFRSRLPGSVLRALSLLRRSLLRRPLSLGTLLSGSLSAGHLLNVLPLLLRLTVVLTALLLRLTVVLTALLLRLTVVLTALLLRLAIVLTTLLLGLRLLSAVGDVHGALIVCICRLSAVISVFVRHVVLLSKNRPAPFPTQVFGLQFLYAYRDIRQDSPRRIINDHSAGGHIEVIEFKGL